MQKLNVRNLERMIAIVSGVDAAKFDLYRNTPDKKKKRPKNDYEPVQFLQYVGKDIASDSEALYYFDKNSYNHLFGGEPWTSIETIEQQADVFEFIFAGVDEDDNPFNSPRALVNRMEMIQRFYIANEELPNKMELRALQSYHNVFVLKMEINKQNEEDK